MATGSKVIPQTNCPVCDHKLDRAGTLPGDEDNEPRPGDITVCLYCTSFLTFTDDMHHKPMTDEQVEGLPVEVRMQLAKVRRIMKELHEKEGN